MSSTVMSQRSVGFSDRFLSGVKAAAKVVADEFLPVWAGTNIRKSQKDQLRQPTFNPNVGPLRQAETQARPLSPIRATFPASALTGGNTGLLLLGGLAVLVIVMTLFRGGR